MSTSSSLVLSPEQKRMLEKRGSAARPRGLRARWAALKEERAANLNFLVPSKGHHGPGAGRTLWVEPSVEMMGTSVQVCGYWPFITGSAMPTVGVPLGRHELSGAMVCADPISWYLNQLVSQPSMFVLGRPGLGKSSLIRRIITVLMAWGIRPMVLGDLKPDYTDLFEAMGTDFAQVVKIGRGSGRINPLDMGPLFDRLHTLPDDRRKSALEEMKGRRISTLTALVAQALGRPPEPIEQTVLSVALRLVDDEKAASGDTTIPIINDVVEMILARPDTLRKFVRDGGNESIYLELTRSVVDALRVYDLDGPYGPMFSGQTTTRIDLDKALCFDLSDLDSSETSTAASGAGLESAVQLVCWAYGSSAISAAKTLAQAGLAPERHYFLVFDELWRILRAGEFMIEFIDGLTRLNRQKGLGQAMCTHTMNDLVMENEAATRKAWGFVERSAMVFLAGLAASEMGNLKSVFAMSDSEEQKIADWSADGDVHPDTGLVADPPGRGRFLLKLGKRPGTPFRVDMVPAEYDVNDTNKRWHAIKARGVAQRQRALDGDLEPVT